MPYVSLVLQGLAMALMDTAAGSLVVRTAPAGKEGAALGWLEAARGMGALLGPTLGGAVFAVAGWGPPFWVIAGVTLLLLPPLVAFVPSSTPSQDGTQAVSVIRLFLRVPEAAALFGLSVRATHAETSLIGWEPGAPPSFWRRHLSTIYT